MGHYTGKQYSLKSNRWPKPEWTETKEFRNQIAEATRLLPTERQREARLIKEAEHAADLRFLRRRAELLAKIAELSKPDVD